MGQWKVGVRTDVGGKSSAASAEQQDTGLQEAGAGCIYMD